jgi:hypothetical protein
MDFAARPPVEAPAAALPPAGYAAYDAEAITDADLGIDDSFDRAFAVEAPAPAAMAPATEAVVTKPRESTLEDELNALLAKMTTRPAVSVASAWPKATPVAMSKESAVPETVAQAVEDDLDAALVADLHAMDLGDARMPGEDVEFDADAFHAALTEADDDAAVPAAAPRHQDAPEVETVDVPERVVALADDLDIPDVPFEDPAVGSKLYDDLENEFAGLLGQMETAPAQTHAAYDDDAYAGSFRGGAVQSQSGTFQQPAAPASASVFHPAAAEFDVGNLPGSAPVADSDPFAVDDLAYDPDDAVDVSGLAEAGAARQRPRRGLLVAGIVCAVAVAGGLGALAMSFGGKGGAEAPALVKADTAPIKVKPENPGGTVIPNQDNKVYEAVAKGIKPAAPEQQKLVTSNEEPVDVAAAAPQSRVVDLSPARPADAAAPKASEAAQAAQPGAKSEDRVQQTAQDDAAATDVPVVTPRKVRTMVVKPDGSLVPREDPAPVVAATEPADPAPQHVVATGDQTGAVSPAKAEAGDDSALKPAKATGEVASTPKTAPIAPQRPSDQPVDVVGEVKPDKVASIDTTASTAGSWSMQIASQPTAESAQSTYQDLARRYAGILGGHDVNIVKADIAGKGTFYRVRVPTGSRNDAIKLCESYKAAGGNCFVSK